MSDPACERFAEFPRLGSVCRLGLATRGNTHLDPEAVLHAVDRGVNYLNWCGHDDGMSAAVRRLGDRRREVFVAVQMYAHAARDAARELDTWLHELGTDYVDAVTYFYLETAEEWQEITATGGAHDFLLTARGEGKLRAVGITSHQRRLARSIAESGQVDLVMIRYNAAHRGAEQEIFPVTTRLGMPVVAYTAVRWGALLQPTPDDPAGFTPPGAVDCYRFVLANPAVTVAIMAPDGSAELGENLAMLDDWRGATRDELGALRAHGDRVRRHAGTFP